MKLMIEALDHIEKAMEIAKRLPPEMRDRIIAAAEAVIADIGHQASNDGLK